MHRILETCIILVVVAVSHVAALEPFDNFSEGTCSGVPTKPVKATRQFIDKLKYISAGSRYHMYRIASALPTYPQLSEGDFYYDFCYARNLTSTTVSSIGFGRNLANFYVTTRSGIYLDNIPMDPSKSWDSLKQVVTLTDNESFAFVVNCWTGVDQRAWVLFTLTPHPLPERTRKVVEDHAVELGFKRENFVFLRYDSCRRGRPFPGDDVDGRGPGVRMTPIVINNKGRFG